MTPISPGLDEAAPSSPKNGLRESVRSFVSQFLREPLVHFLLLGLLLFAFYSYTQRGRGGVESSKQIQLTLEDLLQMNMYFASQWKRPPTAEEFRSLVENKVQEEVLYREALAMGLDKDDTIVKRRMAQKLQFLSEDVAASHPPSTDELKAWFAKNSGKFAMSNRVSFRHLYFSGDRRGQRAQEDAAAAVKKLAGQPSDSKLAASLADPFMFQDYYGDKTTDQLAREFGPKFAQALLSLKPGSWQGPVESGYGWHLVYVDSIIPGRIPAFEEIEPEVKTAWLGAQKQEAWRKAYAEMRAKYTVLLPVPKDDAAAKPPSAPPAKQVPAPSGEGPQ